MTRVFPEPAGYDCPFCKVAQGVGDALTSPSDIVYQDAETTAFISRKWFPNNKAPVIVIPNTHYQDLFDLPPEIAASIHRTAQLIGRAFVELYRCEGISTRQHNGIYPLQEVFHYHFHVFPRYQNDRLYALDDHSYRTTVEERLSYAEMLRAFFNR